MGVVCNTICEVWLTVEHFLRHRRYAADVTIGYCRIFRLTSGKKVVGSTAILET